MARRRCGAKSSAAAASQDSKGALISRESRRASKPPRMTWPGVALPQSWLGVVAADSRRMIARSSSRPWRSMTARAVIAVRSLAEGEREVGHAESFALAVCF